MPPERAERGRMRGGVWPFALAAALVVTVAVVVALRSGAPPEGPVPVAWDRQPCAHCAMHLGQPGFAVELHTADGDVLFFDDPGCYFEYRATHRPAVHAVWFHHVREDRWLPEPAVMFAPQPDSPMGWGLGAVDPGEPGALTLDAARAGVEAGRRADGQPRRRPEG